MWAWTAVVLLAWMGQVEVARAAHCLPYDAVNPTSGKCYRFFPDDGFQVKHTDAKDYCNFLGGTLISAPNAFDESLVYATGKKHGVYSNYWIGLTRCGNWDDWCWEDGSHAYYTNWAPGEPNSETYHWYAYMRLSDGRWIAANSSFSSYVACEFPDDGLGQGTCKGNYTYDKDSDKCFYLYDNKLFYPSALWSCELLYGASGRGKLASITSYSQSKLLQSALSSHHIYDDYYIGLRDEDDNGSWYWTDGSAYSYTNWVSGYPISGVQMDCTLVQKASGRWYNTMCSTDAPFICEVLPSELSSTAAVDSNFSAGRSENETPESVDDIAHQKAQPLQRSNVKKWTLN